MGPTIPLPPQPILTRWGTWLEASVYYCEYFQFIKTVIDGFEENDAIARAGLTHSGASGKTKISAPPSKKKKMLIYPSIFYDHNKV